MACLSTWSVMPNEPREPYRVGARSPSPIHSSDSEDIDREKRRYFLLASRVAWRWYAMVWYARRRRLRERRAAGIVAVLLRTGHCGAVARRVAAFLEDLFSVAFRLPGMVTRWRADPHEADQDSDGDVPMHG